MAGIATDKNGNRRIVWMRNRRHYSLRIGRMSKKQADRVKVYVESILNDLDIGRVHDAEIMQWLDSLADKFHDRLVRLGLVRPRAARADAPTVGALLDAFFQSLDVKPRTIHNYGRVRESLLEYFGAAKQLRDIDSIAAAGWRRSLVDRGYAEATIARRVKTAKRIFRRAVKLKMLEESPMDDLAVGSEENEDRQHFVTREVADQVIAAIDDPALRLVFALARYGGLRCPSEIVALRRCDVDWRNGWITIHSEKTRRYPKKYIRKMPLFTELAPHLQAMPQDTPETPYIALSQASNTNLRKWLRSLLKREGIAIWPKLFQNLRSTRATELIDEGYPPQAVVKWLGHSINIAMRHYLQVTDQHHARAAQKAAQTTPDKSRQDGTGNNGNGEDDGKTPENPQIQPGNVDSENSTVALAGVISTSAGYIR